MHAARRAWLRIVSQHAVLGHVQHDHRRDSGIARDGPRLLRTADRLRKCRSRQEQPGAETRGTCACANRDHARHLAAQHTRTECTLLYTCGGRESVRPAFLAALIWLAAQSAPVSAVHVVLDTELGAVIVELNVAHAPGTSANFLRYVREQFYDGGRFHRSVRPDTEPRKDVPIQVIQGGINPARAASAYPAITLERTNATGLSHVDGAVSMARGAAADSARSDFFICIGDQTALDFGGPRNADGQGFAVFGRVVSGMDVVRRIQAAPVREGTQRLSPPVTILRARVMEGHP